MGFSEGKTGRHRNSEIGNLMSKRDSRDLMIFAGFRGPEPCEIQPKVHYRLRGIIIPFSPRLEKGAGSD